MQQKSKQEGPTRLTLDLWPETGRLLGLGRNATYAAADRGEIPTIRIGKRLLVPRIALERILNASGHPGEAR